jgi:Na+-transporting NADH:ubiquinone oxidoreductase subunit D
MSADAKKVLTSPIVDNNPIALQVLGICHCQRRTNT